MKGIAVGLMVLGIAALVVAFPLFYAVGGAFTGWVLANVFQFAGQWVVDGAKAFGLSLSLNELPNLGAFLGFVGSFFRAAANTSNKG